MKELNIIQVGTFNVENFGDLLFPIALKHELEKRTNLNLRLFSPNGGTMPFYGYPVYPTAELDVFCAQNKVDGIIIGGGDIVRLDNNIASTYKQNIRAAFSLWQYPIIIANKYKIPVVFNCPGVPFDLSGYQAVVDDFLRMAAYVSVRDFKSKQNLTGKSSPEVQVILDSVSLIDQVYPKKTLTEEFDKLRKKYHIEKHFIVIQASGVFEQDAKFIQKVQNLTELINEKYNYQVVFSPIGYVHNDPKTLRRFLAADNNRNKVISEKMSPRTMLALFSHSDGFIGTSLHGCITSMVYGVPMLALHNGLSKIAGFFDLCGLNDRVVDVTDDIAAYFDQNFFTKIDRTKFRAEQRKLKQHFDKIVKIITMGTLAEGEDSLLCLFEDFYSQIQTEQNKYRLLEQEYIAAKNAFDTDLALSRETTLQYEAIINSGFWKKTEMIRQLMARLNHK